jgi:hypothetical protein
LELFTVVVLAAAVAACPVRSLVFDLKLLTLVD